MKNNELEYVYQQYCKELYLYAFSLTLNKDDAEDLVADSFLKAFLSFKEGNLKAWLYIVLRNEFYNMVKKRKKVLDESQVEITSIQSSYSIIDEFFENEQKRWLYKKIYQLSQKEKDIILLSIQSGLKDQEIANIMNLSIDLCWSSFCFISPTHLFILSAFFPASRNLRFNASTHASHAIIYAAL